jgi:hypothetical protein
MYFSPKLAGIVGLWYAYGRYLYLGYIKEARLRTTGFYHGRYAATTLFVLVLLGALRTLLSLFSIHVI